MLLHSIADPMQVFPPPPGAAYYYQSISHGFVEGVRDADGFTVSRLISTDPHHYLDPRYSPGYRLP